MKLKKYTIVIYVLVLAMLLPLGSMAVTADKKQFVSPDYAETYIDGLDNSQLEISIEYEAGAKFNIIVKDNRTGKSWETNPIFNQPGNTSTKENKVRLEKSQLFLEYIYDKNASAANLADVGYIPSATSKGEFYSFTDCVEKDQLTFTEIKDENGKVIGYNVLYQLGNIRAAVFPKILPKERLEELVLRLVDENGEPDEKAQKKLMDKYQLYDLDEKIAEMEDRVARATTEADRKLQEEKYQKTIDEYLLNYPYLATGEPCYILYKDEYDALRSRQNIIAIWASMGYTREEMEADYALTDYVDLSGGTGFTIPVEYKIEGNTFKVEVKIDEIVYQPNIAISKIDILPYFAACDDSVDDGYIFIPDGSGAVINLNNPDTRVTGLTMQIMNRNKDEALSRLNISAMRDIPYYESVIMPVFGMKQDDDAVMCIIEKGYELANISAYIPDGKDKYNMAYATIYPVAEDEIFYSSGTSSNIKVFPQIEVTEEKTVIDSKTKEAVLKNVVSKYCRFPDTNFVLRYNFLSGSEANYSGMANYMRNYLIQSYGLEKIDSGSNIPFYADIYGVIDKKISIAGFPFNVKYSLTNFDEAKIIAEELKEWGIENISLRYLGMVNGGLITTYSDEFDIERVVGGEKGYKKFLEEMGQLGVKVVPEVDITHVYQDKMFEGFSPSRDAVMTLGKKQSIVYELNIATGIKDNNAELDYYHPRWVVSPRKYTELFENMMSDLNQYDNKYISFGSVGSTLTADYNKDMIIDRTQTARVLADELSKYKEDGFKITVEKGYYNTIPYVTTILDIPLTSSYYRVEEYEVPFVQMVLHGLVEYAGEPLNVTQDIQYQILKCIEYGAGVYARFMYEEDTALQNTYFVNLYSLNYVNWLDESSLIYTAVNEVMADIQDQFIVAHERLADNVFMTTYENGRKIVVNYGMNDYVDENLGITVGSYNFFVAEEGN